MLLPPTTGDDGTYAYTADLLALHTASSSQGTYFNHRLAEVHSPLNTAAWQACLQRHPDTDFAKYILSGVQHGFRIGVGSAAHLQSAHTNMQSAKQNPQVISDYVHHEMEAGNILGPFPPNTIPNLHINRFGVIPKKHQPGKWRLITDLSFPDGSSVNYAIDPSLCSLTYTSIEQVAEAAMKLGAGSLLAKIDIKSAYRLILVHPLDRHMLGMNWEGHTYVDGMFLAKFPQANHYPTPIPSSRGCFSLGRTGPLPAGSSSSLLL